MSNPMEGYIQGVFGNTPDKTFNTKNGPRNNVKLKMEDGEFYVVKFVKAEKLNVLQTGMRVKFDFEFAQNGEYTNREIVNDSLTICGNGGGQPAPQQAAAPQQQTSAPAPVPAGFAKPPRNGAQIGNALNNAATILGPGASLEQLEATAFAVLDMSDRLQAGDRSRIEAEKKPEQAPMSQQEAQQVASGQTPAQYAPQSQPAAVPQGYAPQGQPVAAQGEAQGFDDDIPF